jgi:hypothetical protein
VGNRPTGRLGIVDSDAEGLAGRVAVGLSEALEVPLGKTVGVGERLVRGDNEDRAAGGVDPEQAETAAEASMVTVPQPMTVNLAAAPVLAMVVRIFTDPPLAPGGGSPSPAPAPETGTVREYPWPPVATHAGQEAGFRKPWPKRQGPWTGRHAMA